MHASITVQSSQFTVMCRVIIVTNSSLYASSPDPFFLGVGVQDYKDYKLCPAAYGMIIPQLSSRSVVPLSMGIVVTKNCTM